MRRLSVLIAAAGLAGCASSGATPQPFPGVRPEAPSATRAPKMPAAPGAGGYAVAGTALSLQGRPYRNGGSDPSGFDCSGFVSYVFGQHGYMVPRSVSELFRAGEQVAADAIRPGDLVFFDTTGDGPSHVGIVVGGDQFVHAPSSKGAVRIDRVSDAYWAPRFLAARRVN